MRKYGFLLAWAGMLASFMLCPSGWASPSVSADSMPTADVTIESGVSGMPHGVCMAMAGDAEDQELWDPEAPKMEETPSSDVWEDAPNIWDETEETTGGSDLPDESPWESDEGPTDAGVTMKPVFDFKGMIRNKLAVDTNQDDDVEHTFHNHAEFQLGMKYVPVDRLHVEISVDGDYFAYHRDGDWDEDNSMRLYNGYINWSGQGFNVKIGNQIVRWGKTDGFSPLDNVNPEDYREGIAGRREERKLPIPIVNLELYAGTMSIQGLYMPFFVEPELDTIGTDWALFQHADREIFGYTIHEEDLPHTMENGELGIRLATTIQNLDFAFSWLYSRADLPFPDSLAPPPGFVLPPGEVKITDLLIFSQQNGQTVRLTHERQHIYGLELESTLGDFGVRADLAYIDKNRFLTRSLHRVEKTECQAMVGVDYNGPNAWYVNLQFFQSFIIDYDDSIIWADETTSAVIATVSKELYNGNLKPECRFYCDFSGNATMLNPKLLAKFWEPVILELGAELFDGSEETPLGIYSENDLIYVTMEYKF